MDRAVKQESPRPGAGPIPKQATSGPPKPGESTNGPEVELQVDYGPPAFKNRTGDSTVKLNEPFWAALYAKENIILYEPDAEKFFGSSLFCVGNRVRFRRPGSATLRL